MSEPSDGSYKILSLVSGEPSPASITLNNPTYQPVRLDQTVQTWKITSLDCGLRLSVSSYYPYTGVYNGQVMATVDPKQDVAWHLTHEHTLPGHIYTIRCENDHCKAWTVSDQPTSGPNIVIQDIGAHPLSSQLFELVPVHHK